MPSLAKIWIVRHFQGNYVKPIFCQWRFRSVVVVGSLSNREFKVANYSFPKKKIKVLECVKLKQQEVSSEVLVTAIDVKGNFSEKTYY